jgi:hypothetical protein
MEGVPALKLLPVKNPKACANLERALQPGQANLPCFQGNSRIKDTDCV